MARSFGTSMSLVSADPPNTRQVDGQLQMPLDAESRCDAPRRLELADVALPVAYAEREQPVAVVFRIAAAV